MEKKLYLFKGQKMFLLKENIAGSPVGVKLSRGVKERTKKISTLAQSILQIVGKIPFDAITVVFGPPPNFSRKRFNSPSKEEIQKVKSILGPIFS